MTGRWPRPTVWMKESRARGRPGNAEPPAKSKTRELFVFDRLGQPLQIRRAWSSPMHGRRLRSSWWRCRAACRSIHRRRALSPSTSPKDVLKDLEQIDLLDTRTEPSAVPADATAATPASSPNCRPGPMYELLARSRPDRGPSRPRPDKAARFGKHHQVARRPGCRRMVASGGCSRTRRLVGRSSAQQWSIGALSPNIRSRSSAAVRPGATLI